MLGKTNITALSEGTVATEIKDYNWIRMQVGVYGNFTKAIYENGYLVAITGDGKVVYTTDGETWQVSAPEYTDCVLNDIDWDGERFIIAGSYVGTAGEKNEKYQLGLILGTIDFVSYEELANGTDGDFVEPLYDKEYLAIRPVNGKYEVLSMLNRNGSLYMYRYMGKIGEFDRQDSNAVIRSSYTCIRETVSVAKNSDEMLIAGVFLNNGTKGYFIISSKNVQLILFRIDASTYNKIISVLECKDDVYYILRTNYNSSYIYNFSKILSSGEEIILSQGIDYGFVDGAYFNECQLFINNHEMLIVKKGESVADKTLDDLVEIAPENTMTCITKAFGQLFIFGNQGFVLKSSVDSNNAESLLIQAISAKKALLDSKAYTDQRFAILEEKISMLEAKPGE